MTQFVDNAVMSTWHEELETLSDSAWKACTQRVSQYREQDINLEAIDYTAVTQLLARTFEPLITLYAGLILKHCQIAGGVPALVPVPLASTSADNVFRKEGDVWTIAYHGQTVRVKDNKGLYYIANLLQSPMQSFPVMTLAAAIEGRSIDTRSPHSKAVASEKLTELRLSTTPGADVDPILDVQSKQAYKHRLEELREELEESQQCHDLGRTLSIQAEIEMLVDQLTKATNLFGRDRQQADPTERVRKAVSKAMRRSLTKIQQHHPVLWRHLNATLRIGSSLSYCPDVTMTWTVEY